MPMYVWSSLIHAWVPSFIMTFFAKTGGQSNGWQNWLLSSKKYSPDGCSWDRAIRFSVSSMNVFVQIVVGRPIEPSFLTTNWRITLGLLRRPREISLLRRWTFWECPATPRCPGVGSVQRSWGRGVVCRFAAPSATWRWKFDAVEPPMVGAMAIVPCSPLLLRWLAGIGWPWFACP